MNRTGDEGRNTREKVHHKALNSDQSELGNTVALCDGAMTMRLSGTPYNMSTFHGLWKLAPWTIPALKDKRVSKIMTEFDAISIK